MTVLLPGAAILVLIAVRWIYGPRRAPWPNLLLRAGVVASAIAALALGRVQQSSSAEPAEIVVLVDVSASMADEDLPALAAAVHGIRDANPEARVWAVPFAGVPLVEAPIPLADLDIARLRGTWSAAPYDRTDVASAVGFADAWATSREATVRLVLVSDGLCNPGDTTGLAAPARPLDLALVPSTRSRAFASDVLAGHVIEQGGEALITANLHAGTGAAHVGTATFLRAGQPLACVDNQPVELRPGEQTVVSCRVTPETTTEWKPGMHQIAVRTGPEDLPIEAFLRVVADDGPILVGASATGHAFWQTVLEGELQLRSAPVARLRSALDPLAVPVVIVDGSGIDGLDAAMETQLIAYVRGGGTLVAVQGKSARGLDRLAETRLLDFLPLTPLSEQEIRGNALMVAIVDAYENMTVINGTRDKVIDLVYSPIATAFPGDAACIWAENERGVRPVPYENRPCMTIDDAVSHARKLRAGLYAAFGARGTDNIDLKQLKAFIDQRRVSNGLMFFITHPFMHPRVYCNDNHSSIDPYGMCNDVPPLDATLRFYAKLGLRIAFIIIDPEGHAVRSNGGRVADEVTCEGSHCVSRDFSGALVKHLRCSSGGDDCFYGPVPVTHHCVIENGKFVNKLQGDEPCQLLLRPTGDLLNQYQDKQVTPRCASRCDGLDIEPDAFPTHRGYRPTRLSSTGDELLLVDQDDGETPLAALRMVRGNSSPGRTISIATDPAGAFATASDRAARKALTSYFRALLIEDRQRQAAGSATIQLKRTDASYTLRISMGPGPFHGTVAAQLWDKDRTAPQSFALESSDLGWTQAIPAAWLTNCPCTLELGDDKQRQGGLGAIVIHTAPSKAPALARELGPGGRPCPGLHEAVRASGGRPLAPSQRLPLATPTPLAGQVHFTPPITLLWLALLGFFLDVLFDRWRPMRWPRQ